MRRDIPLTNRARCDLKALWKVVRRGVLLGDFFTRPCSCLSKRAWWYYLPYSTKNRMPLSYVHPRTLLKRKLVLIMRQLFCLTPLLFTLSPSLSLSHTFSSLSLPSSILIMRTSPSLTIPGRGRCRRDTSTTPRSRI